MNGIDPQVVRLAAIANDTAAAVNRQMIKHGLSSDQVMQVETPQGIDYVAKGGGTLVRVKMKKHKTIISEAR